jgi:hypothetical protein
MESKYVFVPYESFDGVKFGASRVDVRSVFGDFAEFSKTKFSKNTTDDFGSFHAYYDSADTLEALEVFEGEVLLDGVQIFYKDKDKMFAAIEIVDGEPVNTKDTILSTKLGLSAHAPEVVESILLYRNGYLGSACK